MRIAVVGGGISGLVAAYRARQRFGPDADIVLLERGERVGGVLHTGELGGGPLDFGAEAFVGRRPEVIDLMTELGLADQLVRPAGKRPLVWAGGATHPLPARTLMGIPSDAESLRGLVDDDALNWIETEAERPFSWTPGSDTDVASLVVDRFGEQVVRRSVDPLLGGVYAGMASSIGVRAALPTLAAALDRGAPNLTAAVKAALPAPSTEPVFGALRDGYATLTAALVAASDARVITNTAVTRIAPAAQSGWIVDPLGRVDALILAVPAPTVARLLRPFAPEAAATAATIEPSSSVVVALALPLDTELPDNSGILIATGEPLRAKAFTLSSRKWPHLADREHLLVRASFGRFGDDSAQRWSDDELITAASEDLATVTGVKIAPAHAHVQRWPGALAQYAPNHGATITELQTRTSEFANLALAGAYLNGVGVPACVASGTRAVTQLSQV
ncbi:protoporphyrinogen oxidase [Nocardia camponoti]|uniref:Coproporphyrinogen III oxidase n=1 Tax=Nocardia camponoti TaxID=1616106 RepID=A0A917QAQ6_9NOCA|nr:protoporphyrinogen oxidase [Nocardia camponoti]GGK40847.1 protoporphyrinogen oxidase [Nocardia camponoti]